MRDRCVVRTLARPFEIQRSPHQLSSVLRELASSVGSQAGALHAVTMTAELSQIFRTKREGVTAVVNGVTAAFPQSTIFVYGTDGRFYQPEEARQQPLLVAAANWAATAAAVAADVPNAILIDTGTTTTDIIPLVAGRPAPIGRTDPERLASGELVYTGAVRTPVEAIVSHVPFGKGLAGVSAEGFALAGDVHVWRGALAPADYLVEPPDGRPVTRDTAAVRLARVICADREMLDDEGVNAIAETVASAQVARIAEALRRVRSRHFELDTAVVTGVGAFLGSAAARQAGLEVMRLPERLQPDAAQCTAAAAVALLLDSFLSHAVRP